MGLIWSHMDGLWAETSPSQCGQTWSPHTDFKAVFTSNTTKAWLKSSWHCDPHFEIGSGVLCWCLYSMRIFEQQGVWGVHIHWPKSGIHGQLLLETPRGMPFYIQGHWNIMDFDWVLEGCAGFKGSEGRSGYSNVQEVTIPPSNACLSVSRLGQLGSPVIRE